MKDQELWTPLLTPGETLVWTGRPSTGWHFRKTDWPIFFVAAANAGLPALVFLNAKLRSEVPGWFLGLIVGKVGMAKRVPSAMGASELPTRRRL